MRRLVGPALVALALAGCSEESPSATALTHDQYQQAVRELLGGEDSRSASGLYFDVVANAHDVPTCTSKTRDFHDRVAGLVRQVEALEPPADAEAAQRDFLVAARDSVRLVRVAADDVAAGRLACGQELNDRIYGLPSTERAEAAIAALADSGYVVFGD